MRSLGFLSCLLLLSSVLGLHAETDWSTALKDMPLLRLNTQLDRTNCVELILRSFRSNSVVKGIVFLPGATDELYLTRRVQPRLTTPTPSLLESINSVTNGGFIRATFRPPFLLLHTDSDPLEPRIAEEPGAVLPSFPKNVTATDLSFIDRDWERIQPELRRLLGVSVIPASDSRESWHFYRHHMRGFQLSGHELLEAICLSGKTQATINRHGGLFRNRIQIIFSRDKRIQ
jgi:hypothetical protein